MINSRYPSTGSNNSESQEFSKLAHHKRTSSGFSNKKSNSGTHTRNQSGDNAFLNVSGLRTEETQPSQQQTGPTNTSSFVNMTHHNASSNSLNISSMNHTNTVLNTSWNHNATVNSTNGPTDRQNISSGPLQQIEEQPANQLLSKQNPKALPIQKPEIPTQSVKRKWVVEKPVEAPKEKRGHVSASSMAVTASSCNEKNVRFALSRNGLTESSSNLLQHVNTERVSTLFQVTLKFFNIIFLRD